MDTSSSQQDDSSIADTVIKDESTIEVIENLDNLVVNNDATAL